MKRIMTKSAEEYTLVMKKEITPYLEKSTAKIKNKYVAQIPLFQKISKASSELGAWSWWMDVQLRPAL